MQNNSNNVTQVYWQPLEKLMNPKDKKSQALSGFDEEFIDIVDYIIRITHRIWEQKNVGAGWTKERETEINGQIVDDEIYKRDFINHLLLVQSFLKVNKILKE